MLLEEINHKLDITEILAMRSEQEVRNGQQDIVSGKQHIAELDAIIEEMERNAQSPVRQTA